MNVDTMTEREIDAAIAEFCGWIWIKHRVRKGEYVDLLWYSDGEAPTGDDFDRLPSGKWIPWALDQYSTDANATREMEAEIQRRNLVWEYMEALLDIVWHGDWIYEPGRMDIWSATTATPADRCRAALRVVLGRDTI